jgi:hypothetical protein
MMTPEIDAPNCSVTFTIVIDDASLPYDRNLQFYSTRHTIGNYDHRTFTVQATHLCNNLVRSTLEIF